VIRNLSAAIGLDDIDAFGAQNVVSAPATSDRVHVRVLEQHERVADLSLDALRVQPALELARVTVGDAPQTKNGEPPHVTSCEKSHVSRFSFKRWRKRIASAPSSRR